MDIISWQHHHIARKICSSLMASLYDSSACLVLAIAMVATEGDNPINTYQLANLHDSDLVTGESVGIC